MARTRLAIALALAIGCTALTGAAFAGPPDSPGKSENAPGQEKKAEAPAPAPAATPPASPGKSESAPGKTKTSKAATPSKGKSASAKGKSEVKSQVNTQSNAGGVSADARQKLTICHATGSASNPFVKITPSEAGVFNGHLDSHQDGGDIIPPFTWKGETFSQNWDAAGQAIFNNNCEAPAEGGVLSVTEEKKEEGCPPVTTVTKTTTETKVEHKAGKKGKVVEISPSDKSAHVRKHGEKKTTAVKTEAKVIAQGECPAVVQALGAPTPTAAPTQAPAEAQAQAQAQAEVTQQAPAGEVAGVQARIAKPKAKARGGVLGALGAVAGEELPFTGLPLWIAALIGFGLVGAGFGARKAMR
jgi:hypothetical protein